MTLKEFIERVGNIPENAEIWVSSDHGQQDEAAYGVNFGLAEGEMWVCDSCRIQEDKDGCDDGFCPSEWHPLGNLHEDELSEVKRVLLWS